MLDFCTPVVFGSTKVASYHKKVNEIKNFKTFNLIDSFNNVNDKQVNLLNYWKEDVEIKLGESTEESKYAFISLEKRKIH